MRYCPSFKCWLLKSLLSPNPKNEYDPDQKLETTPQSNKQYALCLAEISNTQYSNLLSKHVWSLGSLIIIEIMPDSTHWPVSYLGHTLYPVSYLGHTLYPVSYLGHTLYPVSYQGHTLYPVSYLGHTLYHVSYLGHTLYPVSCHIT